MSATPHDNDMGPDAPITSTRSHRRTRNLTIIGALALVLVAGAVLVGVRTTGARSGALCSTACAVGDTGPGGGTVFYVTSTPFACGTTTVPATCKYLEAAPAGWNGSVEPTAYWWLPGQGACTDTSMPTRGTGTAVGTGRQNRELLIPSCSAASKLAIDYRGQSGLADWFVPSKDELTTLVNAIDTDKRVGGTWGTALSLSSARYLSSSENGATLAWNAYYPAPVNSASYGKTIQLLIRPIRAF
ncbi:MAG: hypothetical protein NTZ03_02435 [Actinobacteria bacterium]|nr:hypothetical protein [Actinomycetota bacterium]